MQSKIIYTKNNYLPSNIVIDYYFGLNLIYTGLHRPHYSTISNDLSNIHIVIGLIKDHTYV